MTVFRVLGATCTLPFTTVCIHYMMTPAGAAFQARLLDDQEGANTRKGTSSGSSRVGDRSDADRFSASAVLRLWRYRGWKIAPGGWDVHGRMRCYGTRLCVGFARCSLIASDCSLFFFDVAQQPYINHFLFCHAVHCFNGHRDS